MARLEGLGGQIRHATVGLRALVGAILLVPAGCSNSSLSIDFRITSSPEATVAIRTPYVYTVTTEGGGATVVFALVTAPSGMTLDAAGLIEWTPTFDDIGSHTVRVEAVSESRTIVQEWTIRVHQGVRLGVTLSPRLHTGGSSDADFEAHFREHRPWGDVIAFHTNWRDAATDDGEIPQLARVGATAAATYGFTLVLGIGWSEGDGTPDLTSESEPFNDTWSNQETRDEFLAMVTELAREWSPPYLFLGNEINSWYETDPDGWDDWLSEYAACYDAIKAVSPSTRVFTVFQLERTAGLGGGTTGWANPSRWDLVDDLVASGKLDLLGFTSYPFFEYAAPSAIPADYYAQIAAHWRGPIAFSELGWNAAPNAPFPGSEADQAEFVATVFERSRDLDIELGVWLFLHDLDDPSPFPAFATIGLRSSDGFDVRAADAAWRAAVTVRQR